MEPKNSKIWEKTVTGEWRLVGTPAGKTRYNGDDFTSFKGTKVRADILSPSGLTEIKTGKPFIEFTHQGQRFKIDLSTKKGVRKLPPKKKK